MYDKAPRKKIFLLSLCHKGINLMSLKCNYLRRQIKHCPPSPETEERKKREEEKNQSHKKIVFHSHITPAIERQ